MSDFSDISAAGKGAAQNVAAKAGQAGAWAKTTVGGWGNSLQGTWNKVKPAESGAADGGDGGADPEQGMSQPPPAYNAPAYPAAMAGPAPVVNPGMPPAGAPPAPSGAPPAPSGGPGGLFGNIRPMGIFGPRPPPQGAAPQIVPQPGPSGPALPADVRAKEAELKRREAELEAKTKALKKTEAELIKSGALKKKNWPICYPMTYHNIPEDIPAEKQRIVRFAYASYLGLVLCLCANLFCGAVMLGFDAQDKVGSFFLSFIYFVAGIPLAFLFWYKKLYDATAADSARSYVAFFIWYLAHCGFCVFATIAAPISTGRWSFAGFVSSMQALTINGFVGVIYICTAVAWALESLWSLWTLKTIYQDFRGRGGGAAVQKQVQKEATKGIIKGMFSRS